MSYGFDSSRLRQLDTLSESEAYAFCVGLEAHLRTSSDLRERLELARSLPAVIGAFTTELQMLLARIASLLADAKPSIPEDAHQQSRVVRASWLRVQLAAPMAAWREAAPAALADALDEMAIDELFEAEERPRVLHSPPPSVAHARAVIGGTMVTPPYRLGALDGEDWVAHRHEGLWAIEQTTGPARLVLAPSGGYARLLRQLAGTMRGPYGLLHVLLVSRSGHEPGRYQSTHPMEEAELEAFLSGFGEYLEHDGRHHTWIFGLGDQQQIIYDNHDLIYCYGDIERFRSIATQAGMRQGTVRIPAPHSHQYNAEFDSEETRIFETVEWTHFPLEPGDDP
jgi:hypothetical protein